MDSSAEDQFFTEEQTPPLPTQAPLLEDGSLAPPPSRARFTFPVMIVIGGLCLGALSAALAARFFSAPPVDPATDPGAGGGSSRSVGALPAEEDAGELAVEAEVPDAAVALVKVAAPEVDAGAVALAVKIDAGVRVAAAVFDAGTTAAAGKDAGLSPPAGGDADFERLIADAKRAQQHERWGTALKAYKQAVDLKPDSQDAKTGLGIAMVMSDTGYAGAVPLLKEGVKVDPTNSQAWLALGVAYQNMGRNAEAKAPYREYLKLKPTGATADDVRASLAQLK